MPGYPGILQILHYHHSSVRSVPAPDPGLKHLRSTWHQWSHGYRIRQYQSHISLPLLQNVLLLLQMAAVRPVIPERWNIYSTIIFQCQILFLFSDYALFRKYLYKSL